LTLRLKARPGNAQSGFRFDFPGLIFFAGFIVPLLLALDQVRSLSAEKQSWALGLLVLAIVSFGFLIRREFRIDTPLLPVRLLRQAAIWRADLMAACHGATMVSLVAFMPIYLRAVHQATAGNISTVLLAITAGVGTGSIISGRIISRTGRTMILPSLSLVVATLTLIVFALYGPLFSTAQLAALLFFNCLTMGSVMGVAQVTVQTAAGPKQLGQAASSVQLSRSVGASLGTATISTILFATLAARDPEAAKLFGAILQDTHAALASLSPARRLAVTEEVTAAFRVAFLTLAGFTTFGSILAWTNPMRRV
jgi:predicted MFS family arabinose efflux permease